MEEERVKTTGPIGGKGGHLSHFEKFWKVLKFDGSSIAFGFLFNFGISGGCSC